MKYTDVVDRLDKVASFLEDKDLKGHAANLDVVSNTIEKEAFLKGLKDKVLSKMPVEKAFKVLKALPGWKEKLPEMLKEIDQHLHKEEGSHEAGIMNLIKNPLQMAVLAIVLYAGTANAGVIEDLAERMPEPGKAEIALLETGLAPQFVFEGKMEGMIEDALEENTELRNYVDQHLKGQSDSVIKDKLVKAFNHKMDSNPNLRSKLNKYLQEKDVSDTTGYLSGIVGDAVMDSL